MAPPDNAAAMTCHAAGCHAPVYRASFTLDAMSWTCEAGHAWTVRSKPGQTLRGVADPLLRPPHPIYFSPV